MNQRTGTPANLPNDVASLQALVAHQHRLIGVREQQLADQSNRLAQREKQLAQQEQQLLVQLEQVRALGGEVLHLSTWIEKLKLQIARLKRLRFGQSSEKLDQQITQLELIVDELETEQGARLVGGSDAQGTTDSVVGDLNSTPHEQQDAKRARKLLPDHLPRETRTHGLSCACSGCGATAWRLVGEDTTEVLDYVPEHFKVIRHVRPKYSCGHCQTMAQAPAANRPLGKSPVSAALLAHVTVSKYMDHIPLYRQSEIYERQDVEIDRSTLAGWVGGASTLLRPLVDAIKKYVLAADKLHGDDTPVPVLQPGRKTTKEGRLWGYCRDDHAIGSSAPRAVWFAYSPDRKAIHPQEHLKQWQGVLQADGYTGYNALYKTGDVMEAACWAHARRQFNDLYQACDSPIAKQALEKIAQLYAVEKQIRGKPKEQRERIRQTQSAPLLASYHLWLKEQYASVSTKSDLGRAIAYSLNRWQALINYASDGRIEMDNNIIERQIRPIAIGKKNWLFAGSDNGGHRAAAMYTLLNTAKLNGINPERYLTYVFERINEHKVNQIDQLLPWNVQLAKDAESTTVNEQQLAA
jgi:transposase